MAMIFISYRREELTHPADRIFELLKEKYGADSVFRDVDSIRAGRDFRTVLKEYLYQTDVLLAIIGKTWVDIKDPSGQRRLDRNDDYLRQEIRTARTGDSGHPPPRRWREDAELSGFTFRSRETRVLPSNQHSRKSRF